jgi:hypothetical protein
MLAPFSAMNAAGSRLLKSPDAAGWLGSADEAHFSTAIPDFRGPVVGEHLFGGPHCIVV